MSTDVPPIKKPGFFRKLFTFPQRMSLAGCASLMLAIALIIIVIVVWVVFALDKSNVPWRHSMSWWRISAIILLTIITPIVFYRALRFWLMGEISQYPDIDFAWRAGVEALETNGVPLNSTPIFLILGMPSEELEKAMIDATGLSLRVRGIPEGPGALHWYANTEGIYLVCSDAGSLTALNTLVHNRAQQSLSPADIGDLSPPQE